MPTARSEAVAGVINGKIYVAGGEVGNVPFNTLEVYDPATDSWETKAPLPKACYRAAAGVIDGKLYVVGGDGWVELEGGGKYWSYVGTLHIYTP